ncbi:hypothetical protein BIW11_03814 [Tropilaelaps mercedesae]|uniref:Uncharacterized protein n=1 Tax=Tropilaelaps mercedesae TaxID=418985 RepID=A0A1V9XFM2_9ACAR|nr:hypothetical protein BIW11_03814 [Tropilaelaps mercedesae]
MPIVSDGNHFTLSDSCLYPSCTVRITRYQEKELEQAQQAEAAMASAAANQMEVEKIPRRKFKTQKCQPMECE